MISLDQSGRPFIIIRDQERKKRLIGDEARKANILAANTIGDVLKSSLGPKGMDKMLIDQDGEVTVSNDGATIMSGMPLEDPVAKLLVELSKSQDDEIGDGTTSVVVLASELLRQALTLLEKGVHPVKIADGFQRAVKIAISHLNTISDRIDFSVENLVPLIEAAETSLGSKIVNQYKKEMAYVAVKAVLEVADLERKDVRFDLIKLETKTGGEIKDTRLVNGIIIDKGFSHPQMTKSVSNPKIAILTTPFEPPKLKTGHKIDIDSVEKYKKLETLEQDFFKEMVDKVVKSGANVVFCQWGFDDEANHLLYQNGIHAVRWVGGVDIELLAISTGANIVPRFDDLDSSKLGKASVVKEVVLDTTGESLLFVEGCEKAKTVTILVRGGNKMVIEEVKRSLHDALCVTRNLIRDNRIVYGGGAVELSCAIKILEESEKIDDVDQLVLKAFAEALEAIPGALAENCGLEPIRTVSEVKSRQITEKNPRLGIDCMGTSNNDMKFQNVFDTFEGKVQEFLLATQMARMILKIDEVIKPNTAQGFM